MWGGGGGGGGGGGVNITSEGVCVDGREGIVERGLNLSMEKADHEGVQP